MNRRCHGCYHGQRWTFQRRLTNPSGSSCRTSSKQRVRDGGAFTPVSLLGHGEDLAGEADEIKEFVVGIEVLIERAI